ncbi:MAG: DUF1963 domain-containing protein [Methylocella sp.]
MLKRYQPSAARISGDSPNRGALGRARQYASLYRDALEHGIPAQVRGGYCIRSKLLGWPRLVQVDLELGTESGDRPLRLLLQLDGDYGPGGSVYFLMNGADLAARRFDRNEFTVQVT